MADGVAVRITGVYGGGEDYVQAVSTFFINVMDYFRTAGLAFPTHENRARLISRESFGDICPWVFCAFPHPNLARLCVMLFDGHAMNNEEGTHTWRIEVFHPDYNRALTRHRRALLDTLRLNALTAGDLVRLLPASIPISTRLQSLPPVVRAHYGDLEEENRYEERVVKINRCATVVKGGRRFSFSALVVLGDREGQVGVGFGKANEVPPSVEKAMKDARKNFVKVAVASNTIPHKIVGAYRSSRVVMVPASEGTGVIAGAAVRAVVECAGIKDILTKVHGSTNPLNVVKATLNGLKTLRTREEVSRLRGVEIPE